MKRAMRAMRGGLAVWALFLPAWPAIAAMPSLPPGAVYGEHAVGVATGFAVDAAARLDPWNGAYGDAGYQALLRRIDASGQRRTVVFQLWYPASPREDAAPPGKRRGPLAAASGRRANFHDFFFRDPHVAVARNVAGLVDGEFVRLRKGGELAAMAADAKTEAIGARILATPQGAWQDATAAKGRFPLVILAHGLGGNHAMWGSLAEFLASHGYVVAAPTFVSDGSLPLVFHAESSPFGESRERSEVWAAYERIFGTPKVVPSFYRFLFGETAGAAERKLAPGGVERATTMMQNLFRQRVGDVALVMRTVLAMGQDEANCRAALAFLGAADAARPTSNGYLCALLNGRVDAENVGVAGHSLGSMTAQLAANYLPGVRASFGLNNAPPFTWSPEEMRGKGARRPLLLMVGDEDAFVQRVFVGLFTTAVYAAGGDPRLAFPLAAERAAPDRLENPQPVAQSAWQRAQSDRVLVIVRDVTHGTLVSEANRLFPWPAFQRGESPFAQTPRRRRKPTGEAAFALEPPRGVPYDELGWTTFQDGGEAYLPHVIRDWYALAWFDWLLKGDAAARERLAKDDPFGARTSVRKALR